MPSGERRCLSLSGASAEHSNDSRESNTREKPTSKGSRRPVASRSALRGVRTRLFSPVLHSDFGAGLPAASSRRRGRSRPHDMYDYTDGGQHCTEPDTSGCVRGASGVPLTRPGLREGLYPAESTGQVTASGTSGVYRCYARERTRTPGRGHTYARLRKVGIPLTSLTYVRGTRQTYQITEGSK